MQQELSAAVTFIHHHILSHSHLFPSAIFLFIYFSFCFLQLVQKNKIEVINSSHLSIVFMLKIYRCPVTEGKQSESCEA